MSLSFKAANDTAARSAARPPRRRPRRPARLRSSLAEARRPEARSVRRGATLKVGADAKVGSHQVKVRLAVAGRSITRIVTVHAIR